MRKIKQSLCTVLSVFLISSTGMAQEEDLDGVPFNSLEGMTYSRSRKMNLKSEDLQAIQRFGGATAVLIGPRVALTCGHCLTRQDPLGQGFHGSGVADYQIHPRYNDQESRYVSKLANFAGPYDIGLILLREAVSKEILPLTLDFTPPTEGEIIYIVGQGASFERRIGKFEVLAVDRDSFLVGGKRFWNYTVGGDSGGGYLRIENHGTGPKGRVTVIAPHSSGAVPGQTYQTFFRQPIPSMAAGAHGIFNNNTKSWIIETVTRWNEPVCGIDLDCQPVFYDVSGL